MKVDKALTLMSLINEVSPFFRKFNKHDRDISKKGFNYEKRPKLT